MGVLQVLTADSLDALARRVMVALLDWKYASIYAGGPKRWTAGQEQRDYEMQWRNMVAKVPHLTDKSLLIPFVGDSPIVEVSVW